MTDEKRLERIEKKLDEALLFINGEKPGEGAKERLAVLEIANQESSSARRVMVTALIGVALQVLMGAFGLLLLLSRRIGL